MNIGIKSYLFITCHLASGQNAVESRNQDYNRIINNINIPLFNKDNSDSMIEQFDYVFILGDLNYRVGKYSI